MRNAIAFCRSAVPLVAVTVAAVNLGQSKALAATASGSFSWPASLAPFGDRYPHAGDACRRLGESPATSGFLDHTATLVGCPGARDGANTQAIVRQQQGRVVGEQDGVTLISVPDKSNRASGTAQATAPRHGLRRTRPERCEGGDAR